MDEILGNYSSCSNQVKKTMNAIMLSLNKMSITNGTSNGILASNNEHNSDGMMLESINNLIHEHKNSFLPSKNNFNMVNSTESNYLMRSKNHFRTHKKLRIMSKRHKAILNAKRYRNMANLNVPIVQNNNKKITSCKFCGSTELGERISSCKKRAKLKCCSVEYTLGMSQQGLPNFVQKIEHNTTFESIDTIPNNYITVGENSKSRHFYIHKVWKQPMMYNSLYVSIQNVIFEYSYITKLGEIDKNRVFISGKALHSMLVACDLKKGPFFVYDQTSFKTMVEPSQHNHVMFSVGTDFFPNSTNNFMNQNSLNNYDVMVGNAFPLNSRFNGSVMNNVNFPIPNIYKCLSLKFFYCIVIYSGRDKRMWISVNNK